MFGEFTPRPGGETVFTVETTPIKYGPGVSGELGFDARAKGITRAAVFTDIRVKDLEPAQRALKALEAAGVDYIVYDQTAVEPTDRSFQDATEFLIDARADGVISIGGGSTIDTAKAAALYASHPAPFLAYVNKPIGEGRPVPGPVMPHIALPTTAGTGSECTAVAVFDFVEHQVKTGIASKFLKPAQAIVDPEFTYTLPALVTAATGFDVLTHAIESYTAKPYTARDKATDPTLRPPYQGANPHSDLGSLEAIRMGGRYLVRAVMDGADHEARNAMMYAATMAGVSFGNAGVHIPHAMSYSVAGMIRDYQPEGWPAGHDLCPHGISVVVNAPAAFRFTADANPDRHLTAAEALGADTSGGANNAGAILADRMIALMKEAGIPNGLSDLNYDEADIPGLVKGAIAQQRLLVGSPKSVTENDLADLYRDAMRYW
ncbi:MAG: iron-containing alcohol dehydrogenase [Alphaproteobacteria bacterium]|nr:iron-containing alcohol dehydrogenase [Alphaproteobacteria bacterium]